MEIFSDSDKENSLEENSDEKILMKESIMKKIKKYFFRNFF